MSSRISARRTFQRAAVAALALLAMGQTMAAETSLVELGGVKRLESWEAQIGRETQTSDALVLVEWLADREVTLALVEVPSDQRMLLSRTWRIKDGVSVLRLVDDATGWWAEVTEASTLKLDAIDEVANPTAVARAWAERQHQVSVELAASGIDTRFAWNSQLDDSGLYADFFDQMDAQGFVASVVRGMPATTRQAVRALDSLLSAEHEDGSLQAFQRLVTILAAGLDRYGAAGATPLRSAAWKLVDRSGESLKAPLGTASRAFAARFRSVPAGDPVAWLRNSGQAPNR